MPNGDVPERKQVKLDAGKVTQLSQESLEELVQESTEEADKDDA